MMQEAACAILAGGKGRRFGGRNKALIEIEGMRILDRQLAVLRPRFAELAIAASDEAPYRDTGLPILPDLSPGSGPLAGLGAALRWCPRPHLLVVACDMPYVAGPVVDLLLQRCGPGIDIVAPRIRGLFEPLLAVYARTCLPAIERRLAMGRFKAAGMMDQEGLSVAAIDQDELARVDPALRSLVNLNSAADLAALSGARAQ